MPKLGRSYLGPQGRRLWRVAGSFAAITVSLCAVQAAAPNPAAATTGLERAAGSSALSDYPLKHAVAECDNDKYVVGGGAHIWDDGRKQARLTGLSPTTAGTFIATAETPGLTASYEWKLRAYAICADKTSLRDYSNRVQPVRTQRTHSRKPPPNVPTEQWPMGRAPRSSLPTVQVGTAQARAASGYSARLDRPGPSASRGRQRERTASIERTGR